MFIMYQHIDATYKPHELFFYLREKLIDKKCALYQTPNPNPSPLAW